MLQYCSQGKLLSSDFDGLEEVLRLDCANLEKKEKILVGDGGEEGIEINNRIKQINGIRNNIIDKKILLCDKLLSIESDLLVSISQAKQMLLTKSSYTGDETEGNSYDDDDDLGFYHNVVTKRKQDDFTSDGQDLANGNSNYNNDVNNNMETDDNMDVLHIVSRTSNNSQISRARKQRRVNVDEVVQCARKITYTICTHHEQALMTAPYTNRIPVSEDLKGGLLFKKPSELLELRLEILSKTIDIKAKEEPINAIQETGKDIKSEVASSSITDATAPAPISVEYNPAPGLKIPDKMPELPSQQQIATPPNTVNNAVPSPKPPAQPDVGTEEQMILAKNPPKAKPVKKIVDILSDDEDDDDDDDEESE